MKKFLKAVIIAGVLFLFIILSARADTGEEYIVKQEGGAYTLYAVSGGSETPLQSSESVASIFYTLCGKSGRITLDNIEIGESIDLSGAYSLSGQASISSSGVINVLSGEISFSEIDITLNGGKIRIKNGELSIKSGSISSSDTAILLDHNAGASLSLFGGVITSESEDACIINKQGTLEIYSGTVENVAGAAIYNEASLFLLGDAKLIGRGVAVESAKPINLSDGDRAFSATLYVKMYIPIRDGAITPIFYGASQDTLSGITLYDTDGEMAEVKYFEEFRGVAERNFGAVYLPYEIKYYRDGALWYTDEKLSGELCEYMSPPERTGYTFTHWSINTIGGVSYDFKDTVNNDLNLYANYRLDAPTFSLFSREYEYTKDGHAFAPSEISHPLLSEALISYEWYKDGELIGSGSPSLRLTSVTDSGGYQLKLTLTHGNQSVSVTTPSANVVIKKATVEIPTIPSQYYSGTLLYPELYSTSVYDVEAVAAMNVGAYPVTIELKDKINYLFQNGEVSAYPLFTVLPSENYFIEKPSVSDCYVGDTPSYSAASRFGEITLLYSEDADGDYTENIPTVAGRYYALAVVDGTENYSALSSEPLSFEVYSERAVGLSVISSPLKTDYRSFDELDTTGMIIEVTFNSGRREIVPTDKLCVSYRSDTSFRSADTFCLVSYLGISVPVAVNVSPLEYDLSGIRFDDLSLIYDGKRKSIDYGGTLPVGLDGIPLTAEIVGGGVSVGAYTVVLSFSSESMEYNLPRAIEASLFIMPFEAKVIFEELEFVYDGEAKIPTAYIVGVDGVVIPLEVVGKKSLVGEYTAVAEINDPNYKLVGVSAVYKILKADYDLSGVFWTKTEHVYDGSEKKVEVSGLPNGVSVIGYVDNKATLAGEYTAKVKLSFDEKNYNEPKLPDHVWSIAKGSYDLSGFYFVSSEYIYDGGEHYPTLVGEMPKGKDGSVLEYSFSGGAVNVLDGTVKVEIRFTTKSANYEAPGSEYAFVTVKPKYVTVNWGKTEFVYNTLDQLPSAAAEECSVSVSGGMRDAGEYTAVCVSLDPNYAVSNSECDFVILKAENCWSEKLSIQNIFEGGTPKPKASAVGGEVYYKFFTKDHASVDLPSAYGEYYVIAYTDGDNNYKPLSSEPVSFEIIEIVPTTITCLLTRDSFTAFEVLSSEILTVLISYNNGDVKPADHSEITIDYGGEDAFRYGMTEITVSYLGLTKTVIVTVSKADYDLGGAYWSEGSFVYDGEGKTVELLGLPAGITVKEYVGNGEVNAGEYTVTAKLSYDAENYNEPSLPAGTYRIARQLVKIPSFSALLYNGKAQTPTLSEERCVISSAETGINAGEYALSISLKEPDNYVFEGGLDHVTVKYNILPLKIGIKLSDVEKYWFERAGEPSFAVTYGNIVEGDELLISYNVSDGAVTAYVLNPNYEAEIVNGVYTRHNGLSERGKFVLFVGLLIFLSVVMIITVLILRRARLVHWFLSLKCRLSRASSSCAEAGGAVLVKEEGNAEGLMSIDSERADALISDTLAKDLIRNDGDEIETSGKKKSVVNVDTLSESFNAGDIIDVNKLKEMKLVTLDTAYVKVLARGAIDKPLKIYANDFSLTAVKMIALSGGEAVKVVTHRQGKRTKSQDKKD